MDESTDTGHDWASVKWEWKVKDAEKKVPVSPDKQVKKVPPKRRSFPDVKRRGEENWENNGKKNQVEIEPENKGNGKEEKENKTDEKDLLPEKKI